MNFLLTSLAFSISLISISEPPFKTEKTTNSELNKEALLIPEYKLESNSTIAVEICSPSNNSFENETALTSSKVDDKYNFDHNVLMRSIMYDKKGKETVNQVITMYFSDDNSVFAIDMNSAETGQTTIIYDYDNAQMISLINVQSQKMGMIAKLDPELLTDESESSSESKIVFTKTGQEKTISGYHCIEYLIEDPESKGKTIQKIWMAPDATINWMQGLSNQPQNHGMMSPNQGMPKTLPEGALVQINIEDEKGIPTMLTTIEEANMNSSQSISTFGYTFMNIGGAFPTK